MDHEFTSTIKRILTDHFNNEADAILANSYLLQYLNYKTKSATRGSKARASYGSIYAIYVLVEDYLRQGFDDTGAYAEYEGAQFSELLLRQRELPFGSKLQNHALNHRLNQEFRKLFPQLDLPPILRDLETTRYWINERLLIVEFDEKVFNLARTVIDIINAYIDTKQGAF